MPMPGSAAAPRRRYQALGRFCQCSRQFALSPKFGLRYEASSGRGRLECGVWRAIRRRLRNDQQGLLLALAKALPWPKASPVCCATRPSPPVNLAGAGDPLRLGPQLVGSGGVPERSRRRRRSMPRNLKAYQTSIGFFDLAIAAPTMKAALEAWGSKANLFHQGFAKEADDPAIIAATMAKPGVPHPDLLLSGIATAGRRKGKRRRSCSVGNPVAFEIQKTIRTRVRRRTQWSAAQFPSFAISGSRVSDRRTMIDNATAMISAPP
jgi:hypothetical protein